MAGISYTSLPSTSYLGLGSQGDLFHSANYGNYDAGIGSLTSHPYQYRTNFTDYQQPSSYSNQYLQSTYANGNYSTTNNQNHIITDYTNLSQNHGHPNDSRTITTSQHLESNNQHQTSYVDPPEHKSPVPTQQPNRVQSEQHNSTHPANVNKQVNQRHQSQPPAPSKSGQADPQNSKQAQSDPQNSKQAQSDPQNSKQAQSDPQTSKQVQSDPQNSKQAQPARHRSPSTHTNDAPSATKQTKTNKSPVDSRTTKSTQMRAAAIKQKEETREKQKNSFFTSNKKKTTPPKTQKVQQETKSDDDNDKKTSKQTKKQSNSHSKQHKSRRDEHRTPSSHSSTEETDHRQHHQNKSKKRTAHSDSQQDRYPPLPPIRHGRGPPPYDPAYDFPYPAGHPLRGRYPYYDGYPYYPPYPPRHRYPPYDERYDVPPYIAGYPDPYDGFFDYEKRKPKPKKYKDKKEPITDREDQDDESENETEHETKSKNSQSKKNQNQRTNENDDDENENENENEENARRQWSQKYHDDPYYNGGEMLELWRQERNDYLKKKYKPTVHDVLYSQQFMKSDSYLENQRRRALRESQGYYFPYKKYTLKDYKDLQKQEAQNNPYAPLNEPTLDRRERVKKRQEYASHVERQLADTSAGQTKITPRDITHPKPWHFHSGELNEQTKSSKRERALEYAKVQVVHRHPKKAPRNQADPTEEYVNNLFPQNDGSERENNSNDDDDQ